MKTIDDVRAFWNQNPLWSGESAAAVGSRDFYDSHTDACIQMLGGRVERHYDPVCPKDAKVLDLGCGIGFWLEYFGKKGFSNLTGADLSSVSLDLAGQRCALNGLQVNLVEANAEDLHFASDTFDHVNCSGVIHHSPNPAASISEIHRVLRPGGRAVVAVYYRNIALNAWPYIKWAGRFLPALRGRGREDMLKRASVEDIVRRYDGDDNPIGVAFSKSEFEKMFVGFNHVSTFYHSFPRVLPRGFNRSALKMIEQGLPFMIAVVVEKPRNVA